MPVSFHLDHVGPMARSAADCAAMLSAISGADERDGASSPAAGVSDPGMSYATGVSEHGSQSIPASLSPAAQPPTLGILRRFFFDEADGEVTAATDRALETLRAAGTRLVEVALPDGFDRVHAMHRRLYVAEVAEVHRAQFGAPRPGYGPKMSEFLDEGFRTSMSDYQEALRHQVAFRHAVTRALAEVDALVTPSTVTAAPAGLESTGDPRFNSPWSHAGVPTVSIPCALTAAGMPLSLQLIGAAWSEARLLAIATWCEAKLNFAARPPLLAR
jgi:aspartyl-tRNA(Asn)/glutamyl-tRNA(Gln) amidotransferase subunit A